MGSRDAGPASPVADVDLDDAVLVNPDAPLADVARAMARARVGAVIVVGGPSPALLSESDVVLAVARGVDRDAAVGDLAGARPLTVPLRTFVRDAAELMAVDGVAHLVVVDEDRRVLGVLSATRVLEVLLRGVDVETWAAALRLRTHREAGA